MDKHPGLGPADDFRVFWRDRWYRHETEVRWAYFFGELRVGAEYEPTSVKLLCGCGHRPDFYLGALDAWVEIKAGRPTRAELNKAKALAQATGKTSMVFSGAPSLRPLCWLFRGCDGREVGPLTLNDWLPYDGLALSSERGLFLVQVGGSIATHGHAPEMSDFIRELVAATIQLALMPKDRLRLAG